MTDSTDPVLTLIEQLVRELHPHRAPSVHLDSDLERDLGLDSLSVAELLARLETDFSTTLSPTLLAEASTPRDLVTALGRQAKGNWPSAPVPATTYSTPHAEDGDVPSPPDTITTLAESLDWHVALHPDRLHVRVLGEDGGVTELTYGQVNDKARAVARGLIAADVRPGETVALMLPTSPEYFPTFLGITLAGATPVPIYPPARPSHLEEHLRRQAHILANARTVMLVTVPQARTVARLLRASVETLREVTTPDELLEEGRGKQDGLLPRVRPEHVALLQYTSGSTGNPKGVVLTQANVMANINAIGTGAALSPRDTVVSWLPLYHDMGLIGTWMCSLHHGVPLVSMSPLTFLTKPVRWLQAISDHKGSVSVAPNFAYELCLKKVTDEDLATLDLSRWRLALNGAEAVGPATVRQFTERFRPAGFRPETMWPVYGLAEAAVAVAFPPVGRAPVIDRVDRNHLLDTGQARPADEDDEPTRETIEFVACGSALPGYQLRIVDEHDRPIADRTEGRVQFTGPSATSGYLRNPEATAALRHGDWLDTGDLGYLVDAELFITGRVKDLIIRAGRNLYPVELEQEVGQLPGIRKGGVAVFAVPDRQAGTEKLVVLAETRETESQALEDLRRTVITTTADLVGGPPDDVVLAPPGTVPKTSSGKIRRLESRDRYERGELLAKKRPVWQQAASFGMASVPAALRQLRRAADDTWRGIVGVVILLVIGVAYVVGAAIIPLRRQRQAYSRVMARAAGRMAGIRMTVTGDTVPDHPVVVVSNHASWVDGIIILAALEGPYRFVAGEVFRDRPIAGWGLRRIGTIFVERRDRGRGVADAAQMGDVLRGGDRLAVFPEGGLDTVVGLRPFHLGAFIAAAETGSPVVPMAIRGSRKMVPPGHNRLRRGDLEVVIGPTMKPEGEGWSAAVALRDQARAWIRDHCDEPDLL